MWGKSSGMSYFLFSIKFSKKRIFVKKIFLEIVAFKKWKWMPAAHGFFITLCSLSVTPKVCHVFVQGFPNLHLVEKFIVWKYY